MSNPPVAAFKKPITLRSQVEEYLRTSIMEGHLKSGERLREQELCDQLNISRPTLREALRALEAERLIVIEPHRGPSVARITEKAARDLYALRALLEGYAAHEFARLADDAAVEKLGQMALNLRKIATRGDKSQLVAAKRKFYDVLLEGCDNDLVRDMLPSLLSRINLLRATTLTRPDRLPKSLEEIDLLYERILARDPAGAQKAARTHVQNAERTALIVLQEQHGDDSALEALDKSVRKQKTHRGARTA